MSSCEPTKTVRKLLEKTPLADPWHYRRNGIYYLRVRPKGGPGGTCTVSLKTTERKHAMAASRQLQQHLRTFQLDDPSVSWDQLKEHLKYLAEALLATPTEWDRLDEMALVYSDVNDELGRYASVAPMSVPQAKAVSFSRRLMKAAEDRLQGDPQGLVDIIEDLSVSEPRVAPQDAPVLTIEATKEPLTFTQLADLYMEEQGEHVKSSTMAETRSSVKTIGEALGDLDLRTHTRADLVALKGKLLEGGRLPSTVNKILTRLTTVLAWGVNNGYLERSFDKKLKITKGADSTRMAYSKDQIAALMSYAGSLPKESWERWGLSLGCITGARLGEIHQLTKVDILKVGGHWAISLNEDGTKTLKNKYSARYVPLVDGAYGFDLGAFLEYVQGLPEGAGLFTQGYAWFANKLNQVIRKQLGTGDKREYTFHSLRHSMASLLKAEGVQVELAQSILGHSSQSITFDLYGGGQQVGFEKLVDALRNAFRGT